MIIKIVDDIPGGDGARTSSVPGTNDIEILIEKDAFDGETYDDTNGNQQKFTLERYLAEETAHAFQESKGTGGQTIAQQEVGAQEVANYIMDEAYGEADAVVPPEAGILTNPNSFIGNDGQGPRIHDDAPHGIQPVSYLPDPTNLPPWLSDPLDGWDGAPNIGSPLILDLDGNGIDLASVNGSGAVYWDIDLDDFAEATGWVAGNDGLLAIDLNADGFINNHSELFGTEVTDGFTVLSAYDINADNVIDSNDTQFSDLLVWVDANSNGFSESNELSSLTDLGITSINVSASLVNYEIEGNLITHESTFTINGQIQTIVDAWFTYDNVNSEYIGDYSLNLDAFLLPSLKGFGDIKDLHIAMSMDQTLLGLVQDVADADSNSLFDPTFNLQAKIEDIMYRWAGVDAVDSASRGAYIDARKLEFLEEFFGDEYLQFGQHTDPQSFAAEALEDIFHSVMSSITTHLLAQHATTPDFFTENISYDFTSGALVGQTHEIDNLRFTETSTSTKTSDDNDVYVLGVTSNALTFQEQTGGGFDQIWVNAASTDDVRYWVDLGGELYFKFGDAASNQVFFYGNYTFNEGVDIHTRIEQIVFSDGVVIDLTQGLTLSDTNDGHFIYGSTLGDIVDGRGGNDYIYGWNGDDTLIGGDGNDQIQGGNGDDIISGDVGNDYLYGGTGDDTYVYETGFGNDYIIEESGNDIISFGAGILQSDLTYTKSSNSLLLGIPDGSTIQINNYYSGNSSNVIEELHFDDGSIVNLQVLLNTAPVAMDDSFIGDQDVVITGNVLSNNGNGADSDPEGNVLTIVAGTYVTANGSVTILANGDFTYTPNAAYNGIDSFTYTIDDGFGGSDSAIVNLTVRPPNVAPIAQDDVFIGDQDANITGSLLADNGNGVDSDPDSDPLSVVAGTYATTHGSVTITSNGSFTYTPNAGYVGTDSFTYTLQDDRGGSDIGAASITLNAAAQNVINGTASNDYLYGDQGGVFNDVLTGFAGNDNLYGYLGGDSYVWNVGDGNDTINESGGLDQLVLHGVLASEVRLEVFSTYSLKVHIGSEYITINNQYLSDYYNSTSYDQYIVEKIVLDDASEIDLLNNLTFTGTSAGEYMYGTNQADILIGLAGNDTLNSNGGADIIIGGAGSDTVNGGDGNDIYVWSAGDGNDTVNEAGGLDELVLHGVLTSEIRLEKVNSYSLKIHIGSESITINNQYMSDYYNSTSYDQYIVEKIVLDDASEIDLLNNLTFTGSSGSDYLYSLNSGATLVGAGGNDYLYGTIGNESYGWSVGDGNDAVNEVGGIDNIALHNVLASEIRLEVFSSYSLKIHIGSEYITVNNQYLSDYYNSTSYDQYQVETLLLDDGTVIDLLNNLTFTGTSAGEYMYGVNADETLYADAGNDYLYSYNGNDTLHGEDGSDYLYGGAGDDVLYGGSGVDMLYGQGGADTFVFEAASAFTSSDNIQDFKLSENDKFDISDLLQGYDPLTDAITDFVQITESGTNSYLNVDTDGGADNFVQVAYIYNETGLTDEDALETSGNLIAA